MRTIRRFLILMAAYGGILHSTAIAQVPTPQLQPTAPNYGTNVLAVLPNYTRASYQAAFGKQAPAFDMNLPAKTWFDSTQDCSSPTKTVTYNKLNLAGNIATESAFTIPACQASKVNLPGSVTYPPYVVAPSQVTQNPGGQGVNPNYLSTSDQAAAVVAEIGDSTIRVSQQAMAFYTYNFPANEPRRFFVLNALCNVGIMELQRNANGIGYPGHWVAGNGCWDWVNDPAAPDGSASTLAPTPQPVRALYANESFTSTLMGAQITRSDVANPNAPSSAGGFTDADRAALNQVLNLLKSILKQ